VLVVFLVVLTRNGIEIPETNTGAAATSAPTTDIKQEPAKASVGDYSRSLWVETVADDTESAVSRLGAARDLVENFPNTPEAEKASAMIAQLEALVAEDATGGEARASDGKWAYHSSVEEMTGKASRTARVISSNTINLDFPYAGPQHAELMLRRHPRWGNNVILSIERGQILCHTYGDCRIGVRFDDGKIMRFLGNPPSDNSSEYVFVPAFSTFMKKLPKTKTVKVEIEIYKGGSPVFEFDVSGFKPEKFR